jgi:hypothetical protein
MDIYQLEVITRKGGTSLAEALYQYWPAGENETRKVAYDIKETVLTTYVGNSFQNNGFNLYPETPLTPGSSSSIDLLLLNPSNGTQIILEAKRALTSKQEGFKDQKKGVSRGIGEDIQRMENFELVHQWDGEKDEEYDPQTDYKNKFGIALITTWSKEIISWWEKSKSEKKKEKPHWVGKKNWAAIRDLILNNKKSLSGTVILSHSVYEDVENEQTENESTHAMLYAIFKIP